jgi:hypothetical protein
MMGEGILAASTKSTTGPEGPGRRPSPAALAGKLEDRYVRLSQEFLGYLHGRGFSFTKADLASQGLGEYFLKRAHDKFDRGPKLYKRRQKSRGAKGESASRPSEYDAAVYVPDHASFDEHLGGLFGFMSRQDHQAAAIFEAVPQWLRFLELRGLIEGRDRQSALASLARLRQPLLELWTKAESDRSLRDNLLRTWPGDHPGSPHINDGVPAIGQ